MAPLTAMCQWNNIAPGLLVHGGRGAMTFKDGILWIASQDQILMSKDTGITWSVRGDINSFGQTFESVDCDFFDSQNGLVATSDGFYETKDQGIDWYRLSIGSVGRSVCFGGNPTSLSACSIGDWDMTSDGGITWQHQILDPKGKYSCTQVIYLSEGIYTCLASNSSGTHVFTSAGMSNDWVEQPGTVDPDSWSFGVDPCDHTRIVVVNEDALAPTDDLSQIFLSTDAGQGFQTPFAHPLYFFSGAIAISKNAIYCPTIGDGVYRSTDLGLTWQSVGGPNCIVDARLIVAINDNIILAIDPQGSVWRTTNGGGSRVIPTGSSAALVITPSSVAFPDSILPCATKLQTVYYSGGCHTAVPDSSYIIGIDSLNFRTLSLPTADSTVVSFTPNGSRSYHASLILHFQDNSTRIVPLSGSGSVSPPLVVSSEDITTDTIGGIIAVPIHFSSSPSIGGAGDLDLSLHYDTAVCVYHGTTIGGKTISDLIAERPTGFRHIHVGGVSLDQADTATMVVEFQYFPGVSPCTTVIFDSISYARNGVECTLTASSVSANICSSAGCEAALLSDFIRYQKTPQLRIVPNPASSSFEVQTDLNLGLSDLELYDVLGRMKQRSTAILDRSHSAIIDVSAQPTGLYTIRVHCQGRTVSLNLLHSR